MNKITSTLEKIFKDHRLVFWYNTDESLSFDFNEIEIEGVKKIFVDNNEFGVKYLVVKQEPNQKFLLYFNKPKPEDSENWLLDLNLSGYEFYTDQSSLILQDLKLPQEYKQLVQNHIAFFKHAKRTEKLAEIILSDDSEKKIRIKMLSVICGSEPNAHQIILSLFSDLSKDKDDNYKLITDCNLAPFFWSEIEKLFNYKSSNPSILDFALELFKSNFEHYLDRLPGLSKESIVFISRWQDSAKFQRDYDELAERFAEDLQIDTKINSFDYKKLLKNNIFSTTEKRILSSLASEILKGIIKHEEAKELLRNREDGYWYKDYATYYQALDHALDLFYLIERLQLNFNSLEEGYKNYTESYFKIDLAYRKFLLEYYNTNNSPLLAEIAAQVEKLYSNKYLLPLNDKWQQLVDSCPQWKIDNADYQKDFYSKYIDPFVVKDQKVFVIISDSLRYEIGQELLARILKENRFFADIDSMFTTLPSYTKLGMAALLPHSKLSYKAESDEVLCDDISSNGTANRSRILQKNISDSIAIQADEFLNKNTRLEGREFVKSYSVFYIYSNTIDKIGDDVDSETKVIKAVEDEIENIIRLLKHIVNCNGTNVIITSDHGFIYQNQKLEESDFSELGRSGDIIKDSRRFIIGKNLKEESVVKKFLAKDLGIESDFEFLITKSINRLRVKRAGSRYVHGGASLQEIVIPVIKFNKKRIGEIDFVDVDIIRSFSKITSNQVTISFYQPDIVQDKVQARELRVGFYSNDNHLLSDQSTLIFNSSSDEATQREKKYKFTLISNVNKYNNQDVFLRLEERIQSTNQFKLYKEFPYKMFISFTKDFDEF
ncbi:hypothetical protein APF79_11975 [bacterium BRH_c32]|nr:MAG: hypothetical protein APF79_11975 [bacterium BRH_c32]